MLCLDTQSCPTLCNSLDCSPPGSSVHGDSAGKNTGEGCHALLQGIFPTQGLKPGLPHCRPISAQYWANGISPPGIDCHSLQTEEFFWIVKNHHFLSSGRSHLRIFFFYLSMWIHRLWIEFPKWCAPNGKYIKIHKSNDPPCLGSIRTWVNMLLSIYPS